MSAGTCPHCRNRVHLAVLDFEAGCRAREAVSAGTCPHRLPALDPGDTCSGEAGTLDPLHMTDPEALRRLSRYLRWHIERGSGEADWPERAAMFERGQA